MNVPGTLSRLVVAGLIAALALAGCAPAAAPTTAPTQAPVPTAVTAPTVAPTTAAVITPTVAATTAAVVTPTIAATTAAVTTPTVAATTAAVAPTTAAITPTAAITVGRAITGLMVVNNATLGSIIADAGGNTLYMFMKDQGTTSACTGACVKVWPPAVITGTPPVSPTVGAGLTATLLSSVMRPDGAMQVAYNGHLLYFFSRDTKPGDTNGQKLNNFWFVLKPDGTPLQQ